MAYKVMKKNNGYRLLLGLDGGYRPNGWINIGEIDCVKDFWKFIDLKPIPWILGNEFEQKFAIVSADIGNTILAHCGGFNKCW